MYRKPGGNGDARPRKKRASLAQPAPAKESTHVGRKKGTPNKRTAHLERLLNLGFDPFELARQIAAGEVKDTQVIIDDGEPITVEVPLPWAVRQKSIHELMSYIAPKRKAIEVDMPAGGRIVIETPAEAAAQIRMEAKEGESEEEGEP